MTDATTMKRPWIVVQALGSLAPAAGEWLLGAGPVGALLVVAGSGVVGWAASRRARDRYEAGGITHLRGFWRNG